MKLGLKPRLCRENGNLSILYSLFFIFFLVLPACAGNISTHAFDSGMNCKGIWKLPDTGQTTCYNATTSIACPAAGAAFHGQDGSYTPSVIQPSYTITGPVGSSVTVDNRTGLMWITKPVTEAGFVSSQTWQSALSSCAVTMNAVSYAGYADWRLPNARELVSIMNYNTTPLAVDTTYFPETVLSLYWTSSTNYGSYSQAWTVYAGYGSTYAYSKSTLCHVRCVRGGSGY
ncbi:MAG: hypothetical protein A2218_04170 [Elusimicrobia bacterium RIFOXYA2_FULL_53_38]|nr:MAG: hypothetical protein A2218_04170 [Elusimicrobia bacterium RIFOXYA2_FULL_53_38]